MVNKLYLIIVILLIITITLDGYLIVGDKQINGFMFKPNLKANKAITESDPIINPDLDQNQEIIESKDNINLNLNKTKIIKEEAIIEEIEPLFIFATIADPHLRTRPSSIPDDYRYLKAFSVDQEVLLNYVDDINNHSPPVDFTLVLGDISDLGAQVELNKAAEILNNLNAPYYPIVGNHDNFQDDDKEAWKLAFGYNSTNYTIDYGKFHFIIIDPTMNPYDPPNHLVEFNEDLRNWVKSELISNGKEPTLLINHYPLLDHCWSAKWEIYQEVNQRCMPNFPDPEEYSINETEESVYKGYPNIDETGRGEFNYYKTYEGTSELRYILENYGNIIASINGHTHANRKEKYNNITYLDIGATIVGKPSIRYFYVYSNKIKSDFEYISNKTLFNYVKNMCPDCVSCSYPNSVCNFIDGTIEDKRFTINF